MAVTRAQINWTGVGFTPTTGSAVPITRVTAGMFGLGGHLIKFKGDTDQYPTIIACPDQEPHCSFTTADVGTMMGFQPGTTGAIAAQLNDAKAQTGGAVLFAMVNAVFESADGSGSHAQFATTTGTWQAFSSDGVTNPLSFTRV
jgi:TctA family transporter